MSRVRVADLKARLTLVHLNGELSIYPRWNDHSSSDRSRGGAVLNKTRRRKFDSFYRQRDSAVIPAKAGTQRCAPAFAGMTEGSELMTAGLELSPLKTSYRGSRRAVGPRRDRGSCMCNSGRSDGPHRRATSAAPCERKVSGRAAPAPKTTGVDVIILPLDHGSVRRAAVRGLWFGGLPRAAFAASWNEAGDANCLRDGPREHGASLDQGPILPQAGRGALI